MIQALRSKLTYANAMATIAVFVALGGSAYAVARNSVGTAQLKNNAVKPKKIARGAVVTQKLRNGAVVTQKLRNGAVATQKLRNNAVTGIKVNESTLGTVPSADEVAGLSVRKYSGATGSPATGIPLASHGGLTLTLNCTRSGSFPNFLVATRLFAASEGAGSILTPDGATSLSAGAAPVEVATAGPTTGGVNRLDGFVYTSGESVVTGQYRATVVGGPASVCILSGTLLGG